MNIASWLTLSRLFLLPLAMLPVIFGWHDCWLIAASVTTVAGLTDMFDGYLARTIGQVSALGANLDLISDKVFVGIMLALLAWFHVIPLWAPVIVILREVVISLVRIIRFHGSPPAPDVWGKTKTAVSFVAIVLALVQQGWKTVGILSAAKAQWLLIPVSALTSWVMFAAVTLTVLSGVNYLVSYSGVKNKTSRPEHPQQPTHSGKHVTLR